MNSLQQALVKHDWYPYKSGKFEHRDGQTSRLRQRERTQDWNDVSSSQGTRAAPQARQHSFPRGFRGQAATLTPWPAISSQELKDNTFLLFNPPSSGASVTASLRNEQSIHKHSGLKQLFKFHVGNNINDFSRMWSTHRSCPDHFLKCLKLTFTSSLYGHGLSFHLKAYRRQASPWFRPHLADSPGTCTTKTKGLNACGMPIHATWEHFPAQKLTSPSLPFSSERCRTEAYIMLTLNSGVTGWYTPAWTQAHALTDLHHRCTRSPSTQDQRVCFYTK